MKTKDELDDILRNLYDVDTRPDIATVLTDLFNYFSSDELSDFVDYVKGERGVVDADSCDDEDPDELEDDEDDNEDDDDALVNDTHNNWKDHEES